MDVLTAEVPALQTRFDSEIDQILDDCRQRGVAIHCRRGCANCCALPVHATWSEAERLAGKLTECQHRLLAGHAGKLLALTEMCPDLQTYLRRYRSALAGCPFVDAEGACGVYAVRPIACRALLSTRPGAWCGLDLSSLDPVDKQLYLNSLDATEVDYPTHYLSRPRLRGEQLERQLLDEMRSRYGFSLDGNLALLTWLAFNGLPARLDDGAFAIRDFLSSLAVPEWLVRLSIPVHL